MTTTTYTYGIKNVYRPSALAPRAYGWSSAAPYTRGDVPSGLMETPTGMTAEQFRQNFAYEWFQSSDFWHGESNPPFVSGAAGRLIPSLSAEGMPARILRGYIRRAHYEGADNVTRARLYFMFNPEVITRDYVSYLDQQALDPFNTVFQSGNLVAPPSFMDFSFSLFFDRQEETSMDLNFPGVFVDYQYFDMVVRNVIPDNPNQTSSTLPDNGVMMVNPRDITVVFSPQISVQGRPLNARVNFLKFTHRMVPTRMQIDLTMRVVYIGPIKEMQEYKAEELAAEETIPINQIQHTIYDNLTFNNILEDIGGMLTAQGALENLSNTATRGNFADTTESIVDDLTTYSANASERTQWRVNPSTGGAVPVMALGPTQLATTSSGSTSRAKVKSCDAAGLITLAAEACKIHTAMGWQSHPGLAGLLTSLTPQNAKTVKLGEIKVPADLSRGDILYGTNGAAVYLGPESSGISRFVGARGNTYSPQVGAFTVPDNKIGSTWTHSIRMTPIMAQASGPAVSPTPYVPPSGDSSDVGGPVSRAECVAVDCGGVGDYGGRTIYLIPAAAAAFEAWKARFGGPVLCGQGWRSFEEANAGYARDPNRFAPGSKSWHCKGRAVDHSGLSRLSAADQTRLRNAARETNWLQGRWRVQGQPTAPGFEAGGWNTTNVAQQKTTKDEAWHFSWGGVG